jgi:hypothetical protein
VAAHRWRSAETGEYVTEEYANEHPSTTVKEAVVEQTDPELQREPDPADAPEQFPSTEDAEAAQDHEDTALPVGEETYTEPDSDEDDVADTPDAAFEEPDDDTEDPGDDEEEPGPELDDQDGVDDDEDAIPDEHVPAQQGP